MARVLKLAVLAPLLTYSQLGLAVSLIGGETPIDATSPLVNYDMSRAAILNASGATTLQISARQASVVNLSNSTVAPNGQTAGVTLINSTANITNNSNITSNGTGLSLGHDTSVTTPVGVVGTDQRPPSTPVFLIRLVARWHPGRAPHESSEAVWTSATWTSI